MHRVLKSTGSIFLHCDWHADAYIRVYILDKIFGEDNFQNAIIWCYRQGGRSSNNFGQKHDTIFWYSKTKKKRTFNADPIRIPYEGSGGYQTSGKGVTIRGKTYKPNELGKIPEDWWDIPAIPPMSKERIGYPTQKPESLMDRIIKCASNEGDIILDPFMGGGTTIAVADKLNRRWIGIDQSPMAVKVTEFRINKYQTGGGGQANLDSDADEKVFYTPFVVQLQKYDYDTLRNKEAFDFESWIVQQFGGIGNLKQRGDFGLDGKTVNGIPIQVKRSDNIGRNVIDNFKSAVERYDKNLYIKNVKAKIPVGYIIAFSFGKGAVEEVSRLNTEDGIIIKLVKVEDIVPLAVKPSIVVHIKELSRDEKGIRQIEFTAKGDSPAGIEFYSWDFNYSPDKKKFKASIIMDKEGKQIVSLKAGTCHIAVKVVDNDGLENMETVKLTVNGKVKRG